MRQIVPLSGLSVPPYLWYRGYLQDFCTGHGRSKVLQLKPFHVKRWLGEHVWSQSSRRCAIATIKRALNWVVEEGYLTNTLLRGLKRPAIRQSHAVDHG